MMDDNIRKIDEQNRILKDIKSELHQLNTFIAHICLVFDAFVSIPDPNMNTSSDNPSL